MVTPGYFTTAIAVVAGLCIAIGILSLFVAARRAEERRQNVLFGLFAFAYAGAIMGARAGYLASSLESYETAARVATCIAAVGFSLLIWYVAVYTSVVPRVFLIGLTAVFAVVAVASLFFPALVVDVSSGVTTLEFPWGETILIFEAEDPGLQLLFILGQLGMLGYIVTANVIQFRRGDRSKAIVLAIGIGWFLFTIVQENLVLLDVIDTVFLSDFGFLGFVLAVSIASANNIIATESELRRYQANLEEMVAERTSDLEAAQVELISNAEEAAAVAERTRLARDLHDVVTQLLFSVNLIAGSLPRLWQRDPEMAERSTLELQRLTRGALAEMRTLLRELRPQTIPDTDLNLLITQLTDGLSARHDIPADVTTEHQGRLPAPVHVGVYRIAQEAVNNVAKHADASTLEVGLQGDADTVHVSIRDDGRGFVIEEASLGHMGLDIMRERADAIGAELRISSVVDNGTTVDLTWSRDV